jgi:2-isopropylmalate synthase
LEPRVAAPQTSGRAAQRRNTARRAAVAVGPRAVHRTEASHPALLDRIGIDTADIGLPGAGPHVVATSSGSRARSSSAACTIQANCAARTVIADIQPIADIVAAHRLPIECGCFIGSSPIRQYAEDWTVDYLQRCTEEAIGFRRTSGLK